MFEETKYFLLLIPIHTSGQKRWLAPVAYKAKDKNRPICLYKCDGWEFKITPFLLETSWVKLMSIYFHYKFDSFSFFFK